MCREAKEEIWMIMSLIGSRRREVVTIFTN